MRTRQSVTNGSSVSGDAARGAVSRIGRLESTAAIRSRRRSGSILWAAVLLVCAVAAFAATSARSSAAPARSKPIKIAVFPFELEDVSPAASYVGKAAAGDDSVQRAALRLATAAARMELARSGRYSIVSVKGVDAKPAEDHELRDCHGCEAAIARKLGSVRVPS